MVPVLIYTKLTRSSGQNQLVWHMNKGYMYRMGSATMKAGMAMLQMMTVIMRAK